MALLILTLLFSQAFCYVVDRNIEPQQGYYPINPALPPANNAYMQNEQYSNYQNAPSYNGYNFNEDNQYQQYHEMNNNYPQYNDYVGQSNPQVSSDLVEERKDEIVLAPNPNSQNTVSTKTKRCFHPDFVGATNRIKSTIQENFKKLRCTSCRQMPKCKIHGDCADCQEFCTPEATSEVPKIEQRSNIQPEETEEIVSSPKDESSEYELWENEDRYYSIGAYNEGPVKDMLLKLLQVTNNKDFDSFVILAKSTSKKMGSLSTNPVILDIAHVFTGTGPISDNIDIDVHNVIGNFDLKLTKPLDEDLNKAIEKKKEGGSEAYLTHLEIDDVISNVLNKDNFNGPSLLSRQSEKINETSIESKESDEVTTQADPTVGCKKKDKKHSSEESEEYGYGYDLYRQNEETKENNKNQANEDLPENKEVIQSRFKEDEDIVSASKDQTNAPINITDVEMALVDEVFQDPEQKEKFLKDMHVDQVINTPTKLNSDEMNLINNVLDGETSEELNRKQNFIEKVKKMKEEKNAFRKTVLDTVLPEDKNPNFSKIKQNIMQRLKNKEEATPRESENNNKLSKFNEYILKKLFNNTDARESFLKKYETALGKGEASPAVCQQLFDSMIVEHVFANDTEKSEDEKQRWLRDFKNQIQTKYNLQEVGVMDSNDQIANIELLLEKLQSFFPQILNQHAAVVAKLNNAREVLEKTWNNSWLNLTDKQKQIALKYNGSDVDDLEMQNDQSQNNDVPLSFKDIIDFFKNLNVFDRQRIQDFLSLPNLFDKETVGNALEEKSFDAYDFVQILDENFGKDFFTNNRKLNITVHENNNNMLTFWSKVWNYAWNRLNETQKQELLAMDSYNNDSNKEIVGALRVMGENNFQYEDIEEFLKYLDVVDRPLRKRVQLTFKFNPEFKPDDELYNDSNKFNKDELKHVEDIIKPKFIRDRQFYETIKNTVEQNPRLVLIKAFLQIDHKNLTQWKVLWDNSWDPLNHTMKDYILNWSLQSHKLKPEVDKIAPLRSLKYSLTPNDMVKIFKVFNETTRKNMQHYLREYETMPSLVKPVEVWTPNPNTLMTKEMFISLLEEKFSYLYKNLTGWYFPLNQSLFMPIDKTQEQMENDWLSEKWKVSWNKLTPQQKEDLINWKSYAEIEKEKNKYPIPTYFDPNYKEPLEFSKKLMTVVMTFDDLKRMLVIIGNEKREKVQNFLRKNYDGIDINNVTEIVAATNKNEATTTEKIDLENNSNQSTDSNESNEEYHANKKLANRFKSVESQKPAVEKENLRNNKESASAEFDIAGIKRIENDYYSMEDESSVVGNPREFIPSATPVSHEALREAIKKIVDSITTLPPDVDDVVGCKKKDKKDKKDHKGHHYEEIFYEPIDEGYDEYYRTAENQDKINSGEVESFKDSFLLLEPKQKEIVKNWNFGDDIIEKTEENLPAYNIINYLKSLRPKQQEIMKNIIFGKPDDSQSDESTEKTIVVPQLNQNKEGFDNKNTLRSSFNENFQEGLTKVNDIKEDIDNVEKDLENNKEDLVGCKKKKDKKDKDDEDDYSLAHYVFRPLIHYPEKPKEYPMEPESYTYEENADENMYRNAQQPVKEVGKAMDQAALAFGKIYKNLNEEQRKALKNWRIGEDLPIEKNQYTIPLFNMIKKITDMNPLQRQRLHNLLKNGNFGQNDNFSKILNPMLQPRNSIVDKEEPLQKEVDKAQIVGSKPDWALQENEEKIEKPHIHNDFTNFGKLEPRGDPKDAFNKQKENSMYFVGNGIKLPLTMKPTSDGSYHLSVDLDTLCECKNNKCKTRLTREAFATVMAVNKELQKPGTIQKLEDMHIIPPLDDEKHVNKRSIPTNRIKTASGEIVIEDNNENNDITYNFDNTEANSMFVNDGNNVLEDILAGDNYIQQKMKLFKNLLSFWKNFSLESRKEDKKL